MASVEYQTGTGLLSVVLLDSFRSPARIREIAGSLGVPYAAAACLMAAKAHDSVPLDVLAAPFRGDPADPAPRHPSQDYPVTAEVLDLLLSLPRTSRIGIYGDYDGDGVTS
ncbi:MAG: hypothetical protein Q7U75_02055, partial [Desulfobacterales bacterium]|nr:hypothetical protein [Desulfobacterales bacterium]